MTGREKCELLKTVRKKIAEENGIIYLSSECTYRGKCRGYCKKCDAEARYLESELARIASSGEHKICSSETYQAYLSAFHSINERNKTFPVEWEAIFSDYEKVVNVKMFSSPIECLGFSKKLVKLLKDAGIITVKDLTEKTQSDIEQVGKRNVKTIIKKLEYLGLELKYDFNEDDLLGIPIEDDALSNNFFGPDGEVSLSELGIKERE